jgi:hypothetical protein
MTASRIPPRVDVPVPVTISGWSAPMPGIVFSVDNAGSGNGTATLNAAPTATLTASGTLQLRGVNQTDPGHAGNLQVRARQGTTILATSGAFSVCAIPQNFSVTYNSQISEVIDGVEMRGLRVNNHWLSDSSNVLDLDLAERSEQVEYGTSTGIWAGPVAARNSHYMAADSPPLTDEHGTPRSRLTGPGLRIAEQTFTFNDLRTGATDIPCTNSGFRLTRTAVVNPAGAIEFTITKTGTATTANGFRSAAASGSVSRMQTIV